MGRKRVDLTEGPILPQLLRFALPIPIGTTAACFYRGGWAHAVREMETANTMKRGVFRGKMDPYLALCAH